MKKIFALIFAALIVLTACSKNPEGTDDPQFRYNEKIPKTEATRFTDEDAPAKMRVISASEVGITAEITNISEEEVIFSSDFSVQFKDGGKWYNLEYIADEVVFTEPAIPVNPGESREWFGVFTWLYGKLPEGEYRILKTVNAEETFVIGAEFSLPFVPEEEPEPSDEPETAGPEHLSYLREDFPLIDGSTSLIPLEAGIRAEIFGKTIEEATLDVSHSTTWDSFRNLLAGEVDMIFSVDLSEQQWETADKEGVSLEAIPVAYEGFVFVVNAKNPVDVLTQQQLRDIYSGKITNWKEVGGNDAEIIAYQRNEDSGSQNYMIDFMGEVPLMDAPTSARLGSMGAIVDAVALNDYGENSIGYSVYAYAADMYENGDKLKFIKVDGAEVSKNSMAKGEYPLLGYNYAVYNSEEPADSPVRKLVEWMLSDEGQLAIAKAGYVTLRDVGFDYSTEKFGKYQGTGTGVPKPENYERPNFMYLLKESPEYISLEVGTHPDGTETYYMNGFLKNKELENEINAFILENVKKLEAEYDEFSAEIEAIGGNGEWKNYQKGFSWPYYNAHNREQKTACIVKIKNGYLSVAVTLPYFYAVQDGEDLFYDTETAVWDIISGKRLSLEELFYEGVDIDEVLNNFMNTEGLGQGMTEFNVLYDMKSDFMGLTDEGDWHIDLDRLYFDYGNRYFYQSPGIDISNLWEAMVTEQPRSMENCFNDLEQIKYIATPDFRTKKGILEDKPEYTELYWNLEYELLDEKYYPAAEKINKQVETYLKKYFTREAVIKYFKNEKNYEITEEDYPFVFDSWYVYSIGHKYVLFDGQSYELFPGDGTEISYDKDAYLLFNIETGERLFWKDILTEEKLELAENMYKIENVYHMCLFEWNACLVMHPKSNLWSFEVYADDIKWN